MKINMVEDDIMARSNTEVYKSMYESQRKILKKMIKSIPKSELINILQEMKIISKYPLLKGGKEWSFP